MTKLWSNHVQRSQLSYISCQTTLLEIRMPFCEGLKVPLASDNICLGEGSFQWISCDPKSLSGPTRWKRLNFKIVFHCTFPLQPTVNCRSSSTWISKSLRAMSHPESAPKAVLSEPDAGCLRVMFCTDSHTLSEFLGTDDSERCYFLVNLLLITHVPCVLKDNESRPAEEWKVGLSQCGIVERVDSGALKTIPSIFQPVPRWRSGPSGPCGTPGISSGWNPL